MPTDRGDRENVLSLLDALIEQGAAAAVAIAEEIARRLRAIVKKSLPLPVQIQQARRVLNLYEPLFAATLSDSLVAAWLTGAKRVTDKLPALSSSARAEVISPAALVPGFVLPPILPPPLPPPFGPVEPGAPEPVIRFPVIEEAAKDLAERQLMFRNDFDLLADDAKRAAFTVARVSSLDTLGKIQTALVDNVEQGGTLREFRRRVDEALEGSALTPSHIENVFRTNIASAYTSGLEEVARRPLVVDEFPYRETVEIRDSRLTDLCRIISQSGLNGTGVFRADDPVWLKFRPPRHYQCRCGIIVLSLEDAAKKGVREAQQWIKEGVPPLRPEWVSQPNAELPPGWVSGGEMGFV